MKALKIVGIVAAAIAAVIKIILDNHK